MNMRRDFFLLLTLAAAAATPAWSQTTSPTVAAPSSPPHGAASIPDFSGIWANPYLTGFEPPASGPGPVTNRSRWPQQPGNDGPPLPPGVEGVSDYDQLVGDYTSRTRPF